jgi:hypothetical protein
MIEVCSIKNRRKSVFETGKLDVEKNAYFGIDCNCGGTAIEPADGTACAHTPFVSDPLVLEFLLASAADGKKQVPSSTTQAFENQTEEWLANYENQCLLINNN